MAGQPLLGRQRQRRGRNERAADGLHEELELLWQESGLTVVFVTHNVREAVRLGTRVCVLSSRPGRVVATYDVDIPGQRRIESRPVSELALEIGARLATEVRRHADDAR